MCGCVCVEQEQHKSAMNAQGLTSKSADNDLTFFYDHLSKGAEDAQVCMCVCVCVCV